MHTLNAVMMLLGIPFLKIQLATALSITNIELTFDKFHQNSTSTKTIAREFAKVSYLDILYSRFGSELTCENFCQNSTSTKCPCKSTTGPFLFYSCLPM